MNFEVKIRNIRFLGELAKYNIFYEDSPSTLLDNFK